MDTTSDINKPKAPQCGQVRRFLDIGKRNSAPLAGALLFLAGACSPSDGRDGSSQGGDTQAADDIPYPADSPTVPEPYQADYDIAMTVRSMAKAINEKEPLDSTDYNFSGVLTDGEGAPLFTDFNGFPGQWEVDVISPSQVSIRNVSPGDLFPGALMEYLSQMFNESAPGEKQELQMVDAYDRGDERVECYQYGHTSMNVVTRPQTTPTGEVGPMLEITLSYDTTANE